MRFRLRRHASSSRASRAPPPRRRTVIAGGRPGRTERVMAVPRSHPVTAAAPAALPRWSPGPPCSWSRLWSPPAEVGSRGQSPESSPAASSGPAPDLPAANLVRAARDAFAAAPSVHVTGTVVKGDQSYQLDLRLKGAAGGTARIRPLDLRSRPGPAPRGARGPDRRGGLGQRQPRLLARRQRGRRPGPPPRRLMREGGRGRRELRGVRRVHPAGDPGGAAPRPGLARHPPAPGAARRPARGRLSSSTARARSRSPPNGPPYPLQLSGLSGDGTVSRFLDFSGYGARVPLRTPPVPPVGRERAAESGGSGGRGAAGAGAAAVAGGGGGPGSSTGS